MINYKTHIGKRDLETLKNIIADIEYLRSHGTSPWSNASGRISMDKRFSYSEMLLVNDKVISVVLTTCASCKYVRFSCIVSIDDIEQKQYLKALKGVLA